jgi:hypothetical protein
MFYLPGSVFGANETAVKTSHFVTLVTCKIGWILNTGSGQADERRDEDQIRAQR